MAGLTEEESIFLTQPPPPIDYSFNHSIKMAVFGRNKKNKNQESSSNSDADSTHKQKKTPFAQRKPASEYNRHRIKERQSRIESQWNRIETISFKNRTGF